MDNNERRDRGQRDWARQNMLARADKTNRQYRASWSTWWLYVTALAGVVGSVILLAGMAGWMFRFGLSASAPPPTVLSPQLYVSAYDLVAGRLNLVTAATWTASAMAANLGIMTMVLKSDTSAGEDGGQVRSILRSVALAVTLVATLIAISVWANINSPADVSAAASTGGLALGAVVFGIIAVCRIDAIQSDRATAYRAADHGIGRLDSWAAELSAHHVPQPFDFKGARQGNAVGDAAERELQRRCWRGCTVRVMWWGAAGLIYLWAILGVSVLVSGAAYQNLLRWPVLALSMMFFGLAALSGVAAGLESFLRWAGFDAARHPRRRLVWRPAAIYTVCGLFVLATIAGSVYDGVPTALIVGGSAASPALVWTVLWASRRWPHVRWLATVTWPLWGLVQLSLHRTRARLQRKCDRFEEEEMAARAGRDRPSIRSRLHQARTAFRRRWFPRRAGLRTSQ